MAGRLSSGSGSGKGPLSPLSVPAASPKTSLSTPGGTSKPSKFAVYDLEERSEGPRTFHEAAERGDTSYCVRLIERTIDFDINARDRLMRTALHWAAEMGHHDTAKTLLDFGVDVKIADCTGRTAVHLAAKCGDAEMLRTLLGGLGEADCEALVNAGDHNDMTPVFLALQRAEEGQDAFDYLIQHGGHYNEPPPTD